MKSAEVIKFQKATNLHKGSVLSKIHKIRMIASTIPDGVIRVGFKNYCDSQTIDYLNTLSGR